MVLKRLGRILIAAVLLTISLLHKCLCRLLLTIRARAQITDFNAFGTMLVDGDTQVGEILFDENLRNCDPPLTLIYFVGCMVKLVAHCYIVSAGLWIVESRAEEGG